jgi:hypothetical protein
VILVRSSMERDSLSWKHVVAYVLAAGISATLLALGESPGIAAVPSVLVWTMINRKNDASW